MNQHKVREAIGIAMGVITLIPIDENEQTPVKELIAHAFDLLVDAYAIVGAEIESTDE